jgi:hypothetical protein
MQLVSRIFLKPSSVGAISFSAVDDPHSETCRGLRQHKVQCDQISLESDMVTNFSQFLAKKLALFSKANATINFLQKLAVA